MKIIFDAADLQVRLDQMLSAEGLQLEEPPEWTIEDGRPSVTMAIRNIPPEEQAITLSSAVANELLPLLSSDLVAAAAATTHEAVSSVITSVTGLKADVEALKTRMEHQNTVPYGISSPREDTAINSTHLESIADSRPPDTSPQGASFPGLDENLAAHERFITEINATITEETESDSYQLVETT